MSLSEGHLLICFGLLFTAASLPRLCLSASDWSYDDHHGDSGPSHWKKKFPDCAKSKQSPIDIRTSASIYKNMEELEFSGYNDSSTSRNGYSLENNGHTVQLSIVKGNMAITKGDLPGVYKLVQFHVHWGSNNSQGSEHTVNGKSYPMEIHFVHYNSQKYSNLSEAVSKPDGLAVVGVFAEVEDKSHRVLDKLIEKFSAVHYADLKTMDVPVFAMSELLPSNRKSFFRYSGSLTTPQCQESVTWTVLKEPIKISQTQLNAFRALGHYGRNYKKDTPMMDNFRPVQPLGNRVLLRNYEPDDNKLKLETVSSIGLALTSPTPSVSLLALVAAMLARNLIK